MAASEGTHSHLKQSVCHRPGRRLDFDWDFQPLLASPGIALRFLISASDLPLQRWCDGVSDLDIRQIDAQQPGRNSHGDEHGHSTVRHSYDEVIPKTLAKSVDTISFSSKYDSVVNPDPIVRYCLRLAPRARRITYAVPLGAAPTARQYDEWAQTWEIGTTDVLAHTKGALCRGTSKKQPKATIDTKGAGLIPPSGQGESATGKQAFVPGGSGFHGSTFQRRREYAGHQERVVLRTVERVVLRTVERVVLRTVERVVLPDTHSGVVSPHRIRQPCRKRGGLMCELEILCRG